jgi:hypothetical protein
MALRRRGTGTGGRSGSIGGAGGTADQDKNGKSSHGLIIAARVRSVKRDSFERYRREQRGGSLTIFSSLPTNLLRFGKPRHGQPVGSRRACATLLK